MKSIIIFSACITLCLAQTGPYSFAYQTADGQSRQESGNGGAVAGSYSYIDANGDARQVRYVADANGYRPEGDIGVDKKTAAAAEMMAALAPKAPAPEVKVAVAPVAYPYAAWPYQSWAAPALARYAAPWPVAAPLAWGYSGLRGYSMAAPTHSMHFSI